MAAASNKKRGRRRRGQQRQTADGQSSSRYLYVGIVVLIAGLLAFGTYQLFDSRQSQTTSGTDSISAGAESLEALDIESNRQAAAEGAGAVPVTDRETRFLGPPSDPAAATLAEDGQLGQPTLVWFHADWCHICQRIKPEVVNLGEQYDGRVKIVRLNVDFAENRDTVRRYGVRATPTFVLFDEGGQLRGNVPGYPGYQAFTNAFDQLLEGG
jgi:thioredoxin 1